MSTPSNNAVTTENSTKQHFYPNVLYNRSERRRFYTLIILLFACMGLVAGLMVQLGQYPFAIVFGVIAILALLLIPSAVKSHPIKADVPLITVDNKEIIVQDKKVNPHDIETVLVTVLLAPISKIASENKEYVKQMASILPEDMMTGNVDIHLKNGVAKKSEQVIYTTVEDSIGALTALVGAGVKHYKIIFNLKKINEVANFSITKAQVKKVSLTDVSEKDRRKQLI